MVDHEKLMAVSMQLGVIGDRMKTEFDAPGSSDLKFGKGPYGAWVELSPPLLGLVDEIAREDAGENREVVGLLRSRVYDMDDVVGCEFSAPGSTRLRVHKGPYGAWLELLPGVEAALAPLWDL